MATAKPSKLDDEILVCSICLDTLKDPKILDCLHRFCKRCIAEVIDQVLATDNVFPCPTCRHDVDVPEDGAEGLKGDFLLASILENRAVERGLKGEQEEHPCSSCTKHSKIAAVCPDCGGFLCEVCLLSHQTMKVLQLHSHVVTIADIQSGSITFNVDTIFSASRAPKCSVHKDMLLHINCKTCDKLICPVCAPIHHRSHELEEIETAAQTTREGLKVIIGSTQQGKEEISGSIIELDKMTDDWKVTLDDIENEITEHREKKKSKINSQRDAVLGRVRKYEKAIENQLENLEKGKDIIFSQVESMRGFIADFKKKGLTIYDGAMNVRDNIGTTARILSEDTDNWRVLLASPDLLRKVESLDEEDIDDLGLPDLDDNLKWSFDGNRDFKFDDFEWDAEDSCDITDHIEGDELLDVHCDSTEERFAFVAVGSDTNELVSCFYDTESRYVCGKYTLELGETVHDAHIAAVRNNSIIHTVKTSEINKIINSTNGNIGQYNPEENEFGDKGSLSCIRQGKNEEFIVGVHGSSTLYRCTLQGKALASINVAIDGMDPPVSLALTEDDGILLCDGVNHAVAVDSNGQLKSRYNSRHSSDRPIRIVVDSDNLVYVLWKVTCDDDDEDISDIFTAKGETDEDDNNGDDDEEEEITMVVMQYTLAGTFVSQFEVDDDATMMTTMLKDNEPDVVICAAANGYVQAYCMNEWLKAFCKFVQERDHPESAAGELCGN